MVFMSIFLSLVASSHGLLFICKQRLFVEKDDENRKWFFDCLNQFYLEMMVSYIIRKYTRFQDT